MELKGEVKLPNIITTCDPKNKVWPAPNCRISG